MEKPVIYCVFLGERKGSINRMFIGKKELSLKEKLMLSPEELLKITKSARDTNLTHALLYVRLEMARQADMGEGVCSVTAFRSYPLPPCGDERVYIDLDLLKKVHNILQREGFKVELYEQSAPHKFVLRISWEEGR